MSPSDGWPLSFNGHLTLSFLYREEITGRRTCSPAVRLKRLAATREARTRDENLNGAGRSRAPFGSYHVRTQMTMVPLRRRKVTGLECCQDERDRRHDEPPGIK